jgi:osmotically-inducible protein OsmY
MRRAAIALSCFTLLGLGGTCRQDRAPAERNALEGRSETQPQETADAGIAREVRAKLYGDPLLTGGGAIAISVDGGRVMLEGQVSSVNERTLAEADAATVAGVVGVDNRLFVRSSGP